MKKEVLKSKINPLFSKGIAHRGLHNKEFTENGLKAFKNALDHNVAIELDVHLTKDNDLIVCHDDNLKRTTGKEGIIENLTVKEIKDNYKLLDGGEVPTFNEVLDLINEQIPIVVEFKVYEKNYKPLAKVLSKQLERIKDKKNIFLISFDPRALFCMKKSHFIRGLLVCKSHHWVYSFRYFFESLDLEHVMLKEKSVKRYYKKHFVNVWTIDNEKLLDEVLPCADTVTFQFLDVKLVNEKLKNKF